ncbi:glycoside hydrolase [Cohnella sp. CIP 111063]|uniref:alpha-amylase family protein n=1 Tax=unclassified Cohnella TaxID=2636738 RepID=UPI000B8BED47|nr:MULTISPECIES: alpha-amylase family protein [unclassified Cohnella]OXS53663.1 glycoside hydrolase [Cohnella sp. CIP 111063]PRX61936.1 beta-galactosidase-like protein [Cohnella sp. SGD-V74]
MTTIVFYDASFPFAGVRPSGEAAAALGGIGGTVNADALAEALETADTLVHLHGSYFPKSAWTALLGFLGRGGNLLHIGGTPLRIPVYRDGEKWRCEHEQTAYHQKLNIHEALPVDPSPIARYAASEQIPLLAGREELFGVQPTVGFVLHATKADDHPGEGGPSGPMDAHIHALLKGVSEQGREVAAPAVLLENTKGDFAGGRWLFVNLAPEEALWSADGLGALAEWSRFCDKGVTEMWLKPHFATYYPGEQPAFTLQLQSLARRAGSAGAPAPSRRWSLALTVERPDNANGDRTLWKTERTEEAGRELGFVRLNVPLAVEPGYYEVECRAVSSDGEARLLGQGFWGFDEQLLSSGGFLGADRDYFRRDGKPMPIVGMTYMTSDVARKFLFLPNASVWDRDMAQMARAGINLLRTGIWTAWRKVMFVDGHPYEEVMRAIDAFFLTAKKHGLEVNFTFFAFAPEAWEGVNPYLDPRSVEAQKRFISAVVSRHRNSTHVHWDLINEPSLLDPKRIFAGPKTVRDRFERRLFSEWLEKRHRGDIRRLQELWNMTPDELPDFASAIPPETDEVAFRPTSIHPKKSAKWLDYTLFTMDMHNRWAGELVDTIRSIRPEQLVTVGQDEGICSQRPSPFFYAEAVDYTTVHTWWQNDHLVWDSVFTKTPHKPNLIQETGIMYVETPEGKAKRSETELKAILERKYAYAFATGGAGAVQWIWNTNFYMHNVNESNIGAIRADGTEKPEADVSYDFGAFMGRIGHLFEEREREEVAVVYPYSNDFSNRKLAMDATTAASRLLGHVIKQPFRALSEYHLNDLDGCGELKLIIVPSAHNFEDAALEKLLDHVSRSGCVLLFTGPLGLDAYWRRTDRLNGSGRLRPANVRREETLELDGRRYSVAFGNLRIAEAAKEVEAGAEDGVGKVTVADIGRGKLIHCPLPVELNGRSEPVEALYRFALQLARPTSELEWLSGGDKPGVFGRKLRFREGALFIFVSESSESLDLAVKDPTTGRAYRFVLEPERSVLFAADGTGALIAVYRPGETTIESN